MDKLHIDLKCGYSVDVEPSAMMDMDVVELIGDLNEGGSKSLLFPKLFRLLLGDAQYKGLKQHVYDATGTKTIEQFSPILIEIINAFPKK